MTDTPRIFVADLAVFNAGMLRGIRIDTTKELGEIQANVQAMLEL